jgi:predicted O-methyltransferase YrrM
LRRFLSGLIGHLSFIRRLREQVGRQGEFPAGHYHSPIPAATDVRSYLDSRPPPGRDLPDVDLRADEQRALLEVFAGYYPEQPFAETPAPGRRCHLANGWFCHTDAIILYCFLRHYRPGRIVEVGSGFSTAVMLDAADGFLPRLPELTCIEPYPDRLSTLLRPGDRDRFRLIERPVQTVPPETFDGLEAGDLLFIDSSHVVKAGSDLQFLLFEVLPRLRPGVFVHFHDIFHPFEYPATWLTSGRYWNECYVLRAFLAGNHAWRIRFFNSYAHQAFGEVFAARLPLCCRDPGGSIYLQRQTPG